MRRAARTKAERDAERISAALTWPAEPEPTPVNVQLETARRSGERWWRGWWVVPAREIANAVGRGVTNGSIHARHDYTEDELARRYEIGRISLSQGAGGPWYATEREAWLAYHWAQARHFAEKLDMIKSRMKGLKP